VTKKVITEKQDGEDCKALAMEVVDASRQAFDAAMGRAAYSREVCQRSTEDRVAKILSGNHDDKEDKKPASQQPFVNLGTGVVSPKFADIMNEKLLDPEKNKNAHTEYRYVIVDEAECPRQDHYIFCNADECILRYNELLNENSWIKRKTWRRRRWRILKRLVYRNEVGVYSIKK
jgi:hypothetical protein